MIKVLKRILKIDPKIALLLIVFFGIFLRGYSIVDRFYFAHDGDLFSWTVKDIIVNHHLRLIGQQTSSNGIFIGPLFYYSLVPFFLITSMDPKGSLIFVLLLSILTMASYYYVFKKLFDTTTGLVATFLQAALFSRVSYDIWVVPTVTSSLWEVWFFYVVIMLTRGNFKVFPLLGVLIALMWSINLSLAPPLLAVIVAIALSRKIPDKKNVFWGAVLLLVTSTPFFLFEVRHNFSQTKSFLTSFALNQGGGTGVSKLVHVFQEVSGNITGLFLFPYRETLIPNLVIFIALILLALLLIRKRGLTRASLIALYVWIFSMFFYFTFSSKIISEYYFSNLNVVFLSFAILAVSFIFKSSKVGKIFVLFLFLGLAWYSTNYLLTHLYDNTMGYPQRKAVADQIAADSRARGFPCVAVSYIAIPGENVGFRYFFFLDKLHVNQPKDGGPIYSIVVPAGLAKEGVDIKVGSVGIILPKSIPTKEEIAKSCSGPNHNLTDSLFGYTE